MFTDFKLKMNHAHINGFNVQYTKEWMAEKNYLDL